MVLWLIQWGIFALVWHEDSLVGRCVALQPDHERRCDGLPQAVLVTAGSQCTQADFMNEAFIPAVSVADTLMKYCEVHTQGSPCKAITLSVQTSQ